MTVGAMRDQYAQQVDQYVIKVPQAMLDQYATQVGGGAITSAASYPVAMSKIQAAKTLSPSITRIANGYIIYLDGVQYHCGNAEEVGQYVTSQLVVKAVRDGQAE